MKLGELIAGLKVRPAGPVDASQAGAVRICDLTDDSRTVVPGSLFIARGGTKDDGRKFVPDAIRAGAVAVLTDDPRVAIPRGSAVAVLVSDDLPIVAAQMAERFYGSPSSKLDLIGITGTNGKTTTAHLVHQILNGVGTRCGLIGTVLIDDGREVAPAILTTPPATELSRTLSVMAESGCAACVMEVSSHALEQARVAALGYDIAVFTNLTGDHLDYHGTMDAYAAAKAMLFEKLPSTGWAIVNAEDPYADRMLASCRAQILRCSVDDARAGLAPKRLPPAPPEGECRATIRSMTMSGTQVTFAGPWGRFEVTMRLVGRHNAMNALQALAACHCLGVEAPVLERQIAVAAAPPGRLEPVTGPADPYAVLVDYAHTDDALRKVMETLRPLLDERIAAPGARGLRGEHRSGRLCVVFGCGGDRDATKRPRMGAVAAELADTVIVTSDNPRTERPSDIIDQILAGVPGELRQKVSVDADRARAIERAIEGARPGDIILIAGKGHETDQIMPDGRGGTVRHHFDDREAAKLALVQRRRMLLVPGGVAGKP
jgi:UDP-N-acetylmuramoyl-L-alanyl-D-glutamate--2,6-diaminopimelate ligase